jgi:membrane protein implicated in regulation of membrane protease activity
MAVAREGYPHLPPGREPGPQSRRTSTGRTLGGCAAPAFVVAGMVAATMVALFGVLLASLPGGPPLWPFLVGAVAVLVFFWFFARAMWRGVRPRHATGMQVAVERQELRRGDRVGATASGEGEGELEVGLVCTQSFDVWRRIASDSSSRVTDSASVWQQWVPAPHAALGQRVELALPADGPYSYEGDCVSFGWAVVVRRVGEKRFAEPVPLWVEP